MPIKIVALIPMYINSYQFLDRKDWHWEAFWINAMILIGIPPGETCRIHVNSSSFLFKTCGDLAEFIWFAWWDWALIEGVLFFATELKIWCWHFRSNSRNASKISIERCQSISLYASCLQWSILVLCSILNYTSVLNTYLTNESLPACRTASKHTLPDYPALYQRLKYITPTRMTLA